jgi:hypothetical protein
MEDDENIFSSSTFFVRRRVVRISSPRFPFSSQFKTDWERCGSNNSTHVCWGGGQNRVLSFPDLHNQTVCDKSIVLLLLLTMRKYHVTEIRYETIVQLRDEGDEEWLCQLAEQCIHSEYRRLKMDMVDPDRSPFGMEANFKYIKDYIEMREARYKRRRATIFSRML